jgi:crossover junction endodeoxyribonuclease RuvC
MKISIGLDLSITHTGVVILDENKKVIYRGVIKSKPEGDTPTDELARLDKIVYEIDDIIDMHTNGKEERFAFIENLAFGVQKTTAITQLAGLSYLVRAMLASWNIPFYLVAPTSLKKFALGKGRGEKDHMVLEAYKQFGLDGIDNNIADAAFLAHLGLMILDEKKIEYQYQREVIELVKKQHKNNEKPKKKSKRKTRNEQILSNV